MKLSELKTGTSAYIVKVSGSGAFRKRIIQMGFVRGQKISCLFESPLKNPVSYKIMGYEVSLRRSEAEMIEVVSEKEWVAPVDISCGDSLSGCSTSCGCYASKRAVPTATNQINIVLVGNPNSGKTSLFNALSGGREHVGNYSGVTVTEKTGRFLHKGYQINITDLPGTYSLSAYSPEERYVRHYLLDNRPDVIVNVLVSSNLQRNLYLTTELMELDQPMVGALNMYDELMKNETYLDYEQLGTIMGMPMAPVVAKAGTGLEMLMDKVIEVYVTQQRASSWTDVDYGANVEAELRLLSDAICKDTDLQQFSPRYWAIKLLERDEEAAKQLGSSPDYEKWVEMREASINRIVSTSEDDVETVITNRKYLFINDALQKTLRKGKKEANPRTRIIDSVVTNRWVGFPIFIFLMWLTFSTTFVVGAYPQDWIESGIEVLSDSLLNYMPEGMLRDLLVDGIIGGVGSVIVFIPNILILYLFISIMEGTGYMARASFIMDRIMSSIGLDGKSFIPLLMGFGCNVPAIMSSRTIENRNNRLITILINPFMSCSARLPVYILLAGTFFPNHAGLVITALYLLGIVIAGITAVVLSKVLAVKERSPFVIELPPYRIPTTRSILKHLWHKSEHYMKRIGGIILVASIIIWALNYFPINTASPLEGGVVEHQESYLNRIGKFCEPVMEPLGLNWKACISLLSGVAAKELIISTMGVLYSGGDETSLAGTLQSSGDFMVPSAIAFMVFILLYFPCVGTLAAITSETGSRIRWSLFSVLYSTSIAWGMAFLFYRIASLF
ncbi:MAG: ferrous iron transport protein B [Bacteroidales bacterium]